MNKTTLTFGISLMFSLTPCQAEITTDGSVGPAQDLAGPNFSIGQNLGTLSGANLFHSFSHFNLSNGQSATFTGDAAIQNVISRVTGGEVSSIDGKLISTIGNAGFYFINPAGIVFGEHAAIDVPGAFHASTANELQFADGGKFSANPLAGSSLSMAAPAAFGFLAHTAANNGLLRVEGATLEVKPGQALDLVAGKIEANNATLGAAQTTVDKADTETLGREIRLVALQGAGEVSLQKIAGVLPLPEAMPTTTNAGDITVTETNLATVGNGGGRVGVWGGEVGFSGGVEGVVARNTGTIHATPVQGIDIKANNISLDGLNVRSSTYQNSVGNAGNVNLQATQDIHLRNGAAVYSVADFNSKGNTGNVNVHAQGNIFMDEGSQITRTIQNGDAGVLAVTAEGNITNGGIIYMESKGGDAKNDSGLVKVRAGGELMVTPTGMIIGDTYADRNGAAVEVSAGKAINIYGRVETANDSNGEGEGSAGKLSLHSDGDVFIDGGGNNSDGKIISRNQKAKGNVGDINISAGGKLTMVNSAAINAISSGDGHGHAGNVDIDVRGDILLDSGSQITGGTTSKGNAGNVNIVTGGDLSLNHKASIVSATSNAGAAGNINIKADGKLAMLNRAQIFSNSQTVEGFGHTASGDAGNVNIDAQKGIYINQSYISSNTADSTGAAGNISIKTSGDLLLQDSGFISSHTKGSGAAGNVSVYADTVSLNNTGIIYSGSYGENSSGQTGKIDITANKALNLNDNSQISVQNFAILTESAAKAITPGTISISAQDINLADKSWITSQSNSAAGDITINFSHWLTQEAASYITTYAVNGNGGAITINGGELISLHNSGLETTAGGQGNGGNINLTADVLVMDTGLIQANADSGNGGDINLNLKALIPSGERVTIGGTKVDWQAFTPTFNVIQAASEKGNSGVPNITAPQLNIVGALVGLNNPELDLSRVGHDPCSDTVRQSTLKRSGKGGVPLFNKGQDGYTLEHLLESNPDAAASPQQAAHTPNAQQDCKPKLADKPLQQALTY